MILVLFYRDGQVTPFPFFEVLVDVPIETVEQTLEENGWKPTSYQGHWIKKVDKQEARFVIQEGIEWPAERLKEYVSTIL